MKKYKTLIIFAIVVIGVLITNYLYYQAKNEVYLECELTNNKYKNYEETLEFFFIDNTLAIYTRNEVVTSDKVDEDVKVFEKIKEEAPNYSFFKYNIKKGNNKIYITTRITAISSIEFYNDYMIEKDLAFDDTIDEVAKELTGQGYTCKTHK